MSKPFDYLVVGSGLFGAVFAYQMKAKGKRCLVIDRRKHLGGNVYCENMDGIQVHAYGAHIFHTNDQGIWNFVNKFVKFNDYVHAPLANYYNKLIPLPFNLNTFKAIWDLQSENEIREKLACQIAPFKKLIPKNLEEQALSTLGPDIYETLIKGYTEKQWGKNARDLPAFILKRLPIDYGTESRYFKDSYQGIPIGGYNPLILGLLENIETRLGVDFFLNKEFWESQSNKIVFTGPIDEFFEFKLGNLEYRGLEFVQKRIEIPQFQRNAVINYTDADSKFTRIIEHKHFEFGTQNHTIISHEFPRSWQHGREPFYPINDRKNQTLYQAYKKLAKEVPHVIFGGRLAEYHYYDMHQVIASAMNKANYE